MSKEHGQSKNGNKAVECLVQDVNNVKLGDTPKSKSKHLDVIAEFKKSKLKNAANFVVIGKSRKHYHTRATTYLL